MSLLHPSSYMIQLYGCFIIKSRTTKLTSYMERLQLTNFLLKITLPELMHEIFKNKSHKYLKLKLIRFNEF